MEFRWISPSSSSYAGLDARLIQRLYQAVRVYNPVGCVVITAGVDRTIQKRSHTLLARLTPAFRKTDRGTRRRYASRTLRRSIHEK